MKNLIGGRLVDASDGKVIEVTNPATGELIDTVPNVTDRDVDEAVKVKTTYLSKENETEEGENLLHAFDGNIDNLSYKDIQIAFKVTEPNTSDRILINTAEISEDSDEDGEPVKDIDSTPDNFTDGEDDIDDAPVMLTVALGDTQIYIGLGFVVVAMLTGGIWAIKRYVL